MSQKERIDSKKELKRFFGVGPIGALFSCLIWSLAILIDHIFKIPQISIGQAVRYALMFVFVIDVVYLLIGSNYQLSKKGRGKAMATEGPYQFIRHPIYSVWVYSLTGILSMVMLSWSIIISVVPISIFWSWLVTKEEYEMVEKFGVKYQDYMERTGQFLPSWKAKKTNVESTEL